MDNNYNNNHGTSDSFYSYNNGANNNQTTEGTSGSYGASYQSREPYQNTGYQQNHSYQSGAYGNGSWQGGTYQSGMYQDPQPSGKKQKKKREKKPGGFGVKLAKCAALALVFGLVAGTAFEGVRFASDRLLVSDETSDESENVLQKNTDDTSDGVQSTATSSNYVATDVSDIVEQAMPSIVAITNISQTEYQSFWGGMPQTYESTSCGSGIIVSQDDNYLYIATNNHVVEGASSLTVTFDDESTVSAEIKGTYPSTDLAVLRVDLNNIEADTMSSIKVATLGDSDSLKVGNPCIAIGNALGYGQSVTVGYISALNREVSVTDSTSSTSYTAELIQTDAAINPGNSGGALLNTKGEVIGINSVKYADTSVEGIGYAIPINTAAPIINDLITKEKVDESNSAYLGIAGMDVESDLAETYDMPAGVYVLQVTTGSAAEQAGIQQGDIITEFDGKAVTSMEELSNTLQYYEAGSVVDVKLQRLSNGAYVEQTISVTLGRKVDG